MGVVWLTGTLASKPTARREPTSSRLLHIAIIAAVFALPFSDWMHVGPLAWRFVPESPVIAWTGLALTAAGCAFATWARRRAGNLARSRLFRRPAIASDSCRAGKLTHYTGFLLGLLGTALALGELRGIAALALASIGWRMKSRREEAFMTGEFGAEYTRYQREVKALIPFVL